MLFLFFASYFCICYLPYHRDDADAKMVGRLVRRTNGAGEPRHVPVNATPLRPSSRSSTIRAARPQTSREAANVSNRDVYRPIITKQVYLMYNCFLFIVLGLESKALYNISSNTFLQYDTKSSYKIFE